MNRIDPDGTVSHKNTYTVNKKKDGTVINYSVKTVITIPVLWWKENYTYNYTVSAKGVVKFEFAKNAYWDILSRGVARELAVAMREVARSINKDFVAGRTVGGIDAEIRLHYAAWKLGIDKDRAKQADISGIIKGKPGYNGNDSNFETAGAISLGFNIAGSIISGRTSNIFPTIVRYL